MAMPQFARPLRAASWWLLPFAALLVIIGWETGWGHALMRRPVAPPPVAPEPVVVAVLPEYAIAGGAAGHTEMVQRTLFNPTRRPAPAAPVTAASQMQRGQFALTGTLVIDGKSTAFLREVSGNKSRRVLAGEKVNGMLVAEVKPDRVRLTLGDESEELLLKVGTNPKPTAQPAPAVAAATPAAAPAPAAPQAAPTAAVVAPQPEGTQTLAERRRAARAAAAGEAAAAGPAAPPAGATQPAAAAAQPSGLDPRWGQMDQSYRERAATQPRAVAR
jgi:hypothetical protein